MIWPDPYAGTYANHPASARSLTLDDLAEARAQIGPPPEASAEALDAAVNLGVFALGVPCCAGQDGPRIRVVALEPVTPLNLGVAKMKLERWCPGTTAWLELAAAGCWA